MATAAATSEAKPSGDLGARNCAAPLIAKLQNVAEVSEEDAEALSRACKSVHSVEARRDVIRDGAKPEHVHLMVEGWAARYKVLADGSRQIMAFLIPGDFCDIHITILGQMDHGIVALTPARIAYIPRDEMETLAARPDLTRALWWATLVDEAVLRAWIVSLGRRDAYEATAHLFCELHQRMKNVGLVDDGQFDLPLTQEVLADALGLTPVHVNRSLKRLRADGLIDIQQGSLRICDVERLRKAAGFDPSYLHGAADDAA